MRRTISAAATFSVIVAVSALFALQSVASGAAKPLSSIVLTKTFPGLVASAPGTTNGPIGDAGLHYLPLNNKSGNAMLEYIILHRVTGYLRAFSRKPPNGDGVFIFAFRYKNASEEDSWLRGFDSTFSTSGAVKFNVPGVKGASGFTVITSTSTGTTAAEYEISFDVGLTTFIMITGSSSGDLNKSDAIALAKSQAEHS
jgi:hypothetical protein